MSFCKAKRLSAKHKSSRIFLIIRPLNFYVKADFSINFKMQDKASLLNLQAS
ncbi:hypothetical protein UNSWCS_124 [Campylobacter concisus UNSWCS]|uniref:Uncharacterized protein n=1 Tax=Campylobacter concisus UNSWCS TaxID=1242968 RepID=U2GVK4_9BACT|nr:hypothetical protein UNSWCS_124 [Campylobacter concisus UNSWCS]